MDNGNSTRSQTENTQTATQHSACDNCRRKKLRCSGQRPDCTRCKQKNISCVYDPSERRKRHRPADEEKVLRQAASAAACSQRISGSVPKELQCVFSIDSPPRPLPSLLTPAPSFSSQPRSSASLKDTETSVDRSEEMQFVSPASLSRDSRAASISQYMDDLERIDNHSDQDSMQSTGTMSDFQIDPTFEWALTPSHFDFDMDISETAERAIPMEDGPGQSLSHSMQQRPGAECSSNSNSKATLDPKPCSPSSALDRPMKQGIVCIQQGRCFGEASELLEKLEARKHDSTNNWIDGLLAFQKAIVSKCDDLFTCGHCSSLSPFVMLLLYISDQVIGTFEFILETRAIEDSIQPQPTHNIQQRQRPMTPSLKSAKNECIRAPRLRVSFGEYECASPREWQGIAGVLICMQIEGLHVLLKRYKDIASTNGWQTSTTKIIGLEDRLSELQSRSQRWSREGGPEEAA